MDPPEEQLWRGLNRAVLRHGWIPRLMNVARRLSIPKCFGRPSRVDTFLGSAHSLSDRNGITRQILAAEVSVSRLQDEEEPPFNSLPIREQQARGVVSAAGLRRVDLERYMPETTSSPNMVYGRETVSPALPTAQPTNGTADAASTLASNQSNLVERAGSSNQTNVLGIGTQSQPDAYDAEIQATSVMHSVAVQCATELIEIGTQVMAESNTANTQTEVMSDSASQSSPATSANSTQTESVSARNAMTQNTQTQVAVQTENSCQPGREDIVHMVKQYMVQAGHDLKSVGNVDELFNSRVAEMLDETKTQLTFKKEHIEKGTQNNDATNRVQIPKTEQDRMAFNDIKAIAVRPGEFKRPRDQDMVSELQDAVRDGEDRFPDHPYVKILDEDNAGACKVRSSQPTCDQDTRHEPEGETWKLDRPQIPLPGTFCHTKSRSAPGWFRLSRDPPVSQQFMRETRNGTVSLYRLPSREYNFEEDNWLLQSFETQRKGRASMLSSTADTRRWVNPFLETLNDVLCESESACSQATTVDRARLRSPQPVPLGDLRRYLRGSLIEKPDSFDRDESNGHLGSTLRDEDDFKAPVFFANDPSEISGNVKSWKSDKSWVSIKSPSVNQAPAPVKSYRNVSPRLGAVEPHDHAVAGPSNATTTDVASGQPKIYLDKHGYYVPDVEVPTVEESDLTWEYQSDGNHRFLGAGSFGYVEAARLTTPDGSVVAVAVKRCHFFHDRAELIREGQLYQYIKDLDVIPTFYGYLRTEEGKVGLVSELFGRGRTLADLLQQTRSHLIPKDWVKICLQLTEGLRKIHSKEILYNDVKSNNVLVDTSWRGNPVVKYIDLGLATIRRGITFSQSPAQMRSIMHIAPEVKRGQPTSVESDIWGLGVIFWDIAERTGIGGIKDIAKASLMTNRWERLGLNEITLGLARVQLLESLI